MALRRFVFLLAFVSMIFFLRAIFVGYVITKIFTGIIFVITVLMLVLYNRKKTITARDMQNNGYPMSGQTMIDWWNLYKHPMTVSSESS